LVYAVAAKNSTSYLSGWLLTACVYDYVGQCFPNFLTYYPKSHLDVGRYPQSRTNNIFHINDHLFRLHIN